MSIRIFIVLNLFFFASFGMQQKRARVPEFSASKRPCLSEEGLNSLSVPILSLFIEQANSAHGVLPGRESFNAQAIDSGSNCTNSIDQAPTQSGSKVQKKTNRRRVFVCDLCSAQFRSKVNLVKHQAKICSICNKNVCPEDLNYHQVIAHNIAGFICHTCKKGYSSKSNLNYHCSNSHKPCKDGCLTLLKSFLFDEETDWDCVQTSDDAHGVGLNNTEEDAELNRQVELYINPSNPLQCNLCKKEFRAFYMLVDHIQVVHLKKPFTCSQCNGQFKARVALALHTYSYSCSFCNADFCTQDSLNNHINACVACSLCDASFCTQDFLNNHMNAVHNMASIADK